MSEPIISDEQTAWTALYISDYELVASVRNPLHRRMPIACIEVAYKFTPCLFHRAYTIINTDSEQWLTIAIRQHKGCELRYQTDAVGRAAAFEYDIHPKFCYLEYIAAVCAHVIRVMIEYSLPFL